MPRDSALDASTLLTLLPTLLPRSTSSPLPHPADAVAALVHTIHTQLGFRLVPTPGRSAAATPSAGPSEPENSGDIEDDNMSETTTAVDPTEAAGSGENVLPSGWNARGEDSYTFEYRHEQSSMTFRVRVGRMGNRITVDGMAEDSAPHAFSLPVADIVDQGSFPIPSAATAATAADEEQDPARALGFVSRDAVNRFVDSYDRDVVSRLIPGLSKEGYTAASAASSAPRGPDERRRPRPDNPEGPEPARPGVPPLLVDPLRAPGRVPAASIGHRDLDPLGSMRGPDAGGGMVVDFNHPLFDGRRGGGGGSTEIPDPSHPSGARWDPVGPHGPTGPRFPGGSNPLGGVGVSDPEWRNRFGDEMPPPGEFGPDMGLGPFGGPNAGPGGGRFGGAGGGRFGPGGAGGLGGFGSGGGFGGGGLGGGGGMFM